jgi:(R,R)-butanediol dehydrogenase/meso-butanediol dehydrogenase/diacetyl reductase
VNSHQFLAAVWHGARDIRVEARERRPLAPSEVRVGVAKCGICGSDLHEYLDGPHAIPADAPHNLSGRKAPIVLGHEFCGTVLEVGPGVGSVIVGQRVAIEPEYRCGRCRACRRGDYNLCEHFGFAGLMGDGGMAEEAVVSDYMLHHLPDAVSFTQAAVLEPAAVALHAIRRSGLAAGMRCAIVGAGAIGLLLVQLAKVSGAREIAISDISDQRLSQARKLGATITVNSAREDLVDRVGEVDISFEAAGVQATLDQAYGIVRKGGRLVLVGLFCCKPTIDAFGFVNREVDLISSVGYRHVHEDLIAMVAKGVFDPSLIVTREVALSSVVEDGFARLVKPSSDLKVLVAPG